MNRMVAVLARQAARAAEHGTCSFEVRMTVMTASRLPAGSPW